MLLLHGDAKSTTLLPHSGFRQLLLALATTAIVPSISYIGVVGTNAIAAGLGWIEFGYVTNLLCASNILVYMLFPAAAVGLPFTSAIGCKIELMFSTEDDD